jgi:hypothetical protein
MERRLIVAEDKPPAKWRLQVLIALWVILIAMIIGKLIS